MTEVMPEGARLIQNYLAAQEELRKAQEALRCAECAMSNAESALANWLMPKDMKPGEKIGVWMDDSLFQVELVKRESFSTDGSGSWIDYDPKVTVRTRGKHFGELG